MAKYTVHDPKVKKVVAELKRYDQAYFNTSKPLVSDAKYDKLKMWVQDNVPNHPYLKQVGTTAKTGKKVKLPHFMPSLDKIYPDRGADKYLTNSSGDFSVLDKLDGTSALVKNIDGDIRIFTRGNGTVGQDITSIKKYVSGIGKLKKNEAVRGEFMMKISTFNSKFSEKFENARNTISGQVNSDKPNSTVAKHIEFVAHELIQPSLPWKEARTKLKSAGFNTVYTKKFNDPSINDLTDYLKERRTKDYDIDGLVLIDNKTGDRISFKVNSEAVPAEVDRVEWKLSKYGVFKPLVWFTKPIRIGGVSVRKATAHNAANVVKLGIGKGATLEITRGGDVIPTITGVIKKSKNVVLPKNSKWNSTKVDLIIDDVSGTDSDTIEVRKLTDAFSILGVDGVRSAAAKILVEEGFTLLECFNANEDDFLEIDLGKANSVKLHTGLQKFLNNFSHTKLMDATHIWPSGFSSTRFNNILSVIPYIKLIQQYKINKNKLIERISAIHGMSDNTAKIFIKYLPKYVKFVNGLPKIKIKEVKTGSKLAGMSFVFTKIRNKNIEEEIRNNGGKVSGSVTKTTTAVIVRSKSDVSTKTQNAKKLNIPLLTLNEFQTKYKL